MKSLRDSLIGCDIPEFETLNHIPLELWPDFSNGLQVHS